MGMAMAEQPALVRQWLLLKILSTRRYGVTVKELAEEMQVSEKTARRDLEMFQTLGFPIVETVARHGRKRWGLDPARVQLDIAFAFDEAVAIYLGKHLMEPLAGTLFWDASHRAFRKIRASLGGDALKHLDRFASLFHQTRLGRHDYSAKSELIDQLMLGIENHRVVFITYQSLRATEPVTYDVYPYGLAYHRGSLYLIGRNPQRDEVCHWKVDRIEKAELDEMRFERPEDFDLQSHLSGAFGIYRGDGAAETCIKIRFSAAVARYVEESQWHESQKLTKHADGSLLAEFRLSDTEEIKRWIMSFGRYAVVLEPAELRDAIASELKALLEAYQVQLPRAKRRPVS